MSDEKCEGKCGLPTERCGYCGRFMTHMWFDGGHEYNDWQDYWLCSQDARHRLEHPKDYLMPLHSSHVWVAMGAEFACSKCGCCICHDETLPYSPCVPTGFFIVPTSYPRQGSTEASPPELESPK